MPTGRQWRRRLVGWTPSNGATRASDSTLRAQVPIRRAMSLLERTRPGLRIVGAVPAVAGQEAAFWPRLDSRNKARRLSHSRPAQCGGHSAHNARRKRFLQMNSATRLWRLAPSDDPQDEQGGRASTPVARDEGEFPYRVEVWNYTGAFVEQTLAITKGRSVGFAAITRH